MNDKFSPIHITRLFKLIEKEFNSKKEIFGIPEQLFFNPRNHESLKTEHFYHLLETPIGLAAGPHTQMAQNIISSWLCGARYMELKTVQTLDELDVSKPCIDMQDEGYNCEWSQELKIHESFDEYLNAWIIIHLLNHKFGWTSGKEIGTIFNMSVGYNMEGILNDNVQWFFSKMQNCKAEKDIKIQKLSKLYPEIAKIDIPDCISNNITLSTMHGCPPEEIEKIAKYLISEKKLHTVIKLNPTLLGSEKLKHILNKTLNFDTIVPEIAFEHDLKYEDALKIIKTLTETAKTNNVFFGIKLTNTLESENNKTIFPAKEKMMYMSGRALHPISINLAAKLQTEFNGSLNISFSAGADCFNISEILNSGLSPVTVCSDILKPGGYGRLKQYIESIQNKTLTEDSLKHLNVYAEKVLDDKAYVKPLFHNPSIKTDRELNYFDCVNAPCVDNCPTNQDIPDYLFYASKGNFDKAFDVIMKKNPFPTVLGLVCNHLCQTKCTRINYDNSILIRDVKLAIAENASPNFDVKLLPSNGLKVAIIGAGPSGLAAAYFLKIAGFEVNVYETKNIAGGMISQAIPAFRIKNESILKDVERIKNLGVKIHYETKISQTSFEQLRTSNNYVYVAVGAQEFQKLGIDGESANGVIDAFTFLYGTKNNLKFDLGKKVAIIGGGNTAMDVARTANRIVGPNGKVIVVYRRTMNEMPADKEEIVALLHEGIEIIELTAPEKIKSENNKVVSLICSKMILADLDKKGRAVPIKVPNSEFEIAVDAIIPAIGQSINIDFVDANLKIVNQSTGETELKNVFIGGDASRGAATIIKAVADGRKVADAIMKSANLNFDFNPVVEAKNLSYSDYILKKSERVKGIEIEETKIAERGGFDLVVKPLTKEQAIEEAARCMNCNDVCSVCVTVCPNRANYTYQIEPVNIQLKKVIKKDEEVIVENDVFFKVEQQFQVLNIKDFCNECGNCTTFCPTNGEPYKDKPNFYLNIKSFNEAESGYYLSKLETSTVLIHKNKNILKTLTLENEEYTYETEQFRAKFEKENFEFKTIEFLTPCVKQVHFNYAAEMSVLMKAGELLF